MNLSDQFAIMAAGLMAKVYAMLFMFGPNIAEIFSADSTGTTGKTIVEIGQKLKDGAIAFTGNEWLTLTAYALCGMFFLISLIPFISERGFTIETFVKFFAKLAIGVFVVSYCGEFIDYGYKFADAMASNVATSWNDNFSSLQGGIDLSAYGDDEATLQADLKGKITDIFKAQIRDKKLGAFEVLLTTVFSTLPIMLILLAMTIVSYIIAFSRLLELTIRTAFLPIPLALLSDDGWRGTGGRYIRKWLAILCQGMVLTAIALVTSGIIGYCCGATVLSQFNDATTAATITIDKMLQGIILATGVGISSISIMFKSIGFVNDMFGA